MHPAIEKVNKLIADGIIDVSENNPDSLTIQVWGITKARYKNIFWKEEVGKFLGGGIHESYGYSIFVGEEKIHIDDYLASVVKFLELVEEAMMWKNKVNKVYATLEELKRWDETYSIAKRLGYSSCEKLWKENPTIQGSVYPEDLKVYKPKKVKK